MNSSENLGEEAVGFFNRFVVCVVLKDKKKSRIIIFSLRDYYKIW